MHSDDSTPPESAEQRRLRDAIYRRGATADDVERYRAAEGAAHRSDSSASTVAQEDPSVVPSGPRAMRLRMIVAAGGVVVGVLIAGLLLWGVGAQRHSLSAEGGTRATVRASTAATVGPVRAEHPRAKDTGAREFAAGRASSIGPGRFRYVIASGDTMLGIASRFHICVSDVTAGLPLSMQGNYLGPGTPIELSLARSSVWPDGTVHCTQS